MTLDRTHDAAHLTHLAVIELRLSNERARLASAPARHKASREHIVRMVEKELDGHKAFLATRGIDVSPVDFDGSDDDLLAELGL